MSKDTCIFDKAWIGRCQNPREDGMLYCKEHLNKKCCSCGAQATHECAETGQFVCGFLLCDDCEHTIVYEGHNGGVGFVDKGTAPEGLKGHCKKTEQVYKPWYMRRKFTHKVIDITISPDQNPECFAGDLEECENFVREQNSFGLEIYPLLPEEKKALEDADALIIHKH